MGSFISRFKRKKPTTLEQLIEIEESLKKIEDYKKYTEQRHKRTVANILIYGVVLYFIICGLVFYLPETWFVRLLLLVPFLVVPFIILGLRRFIARYFNSKMIKANAEYEDLQKKKKQIIDNIMETETFNKAKEILSKYAPEILGRREYSPIPSPQSKTTAVALAPLPSTQDNLNLRKRTAGNQSVSQILRKHVGGNLQVIIPSRQIPNPVFPRNRGFADKLFELITGDGPGNRFALICKHCNGHNGMAVEEEFSFMEYYCCYCLEFNPARNERSQSPNGLSILAGEVEKSEENASGDVLQVNNQDTNRPLVDNDEEEKGEEKASVDVPRANNQDTNRPLVDNGGEVEKNREKASGYDLESNSQDTTTQFVDNDESLSVIHNADMTDNCPELKTALNTAS